MDDISLLVPHQANLRIIQAAAQRLGPPDERPAVVIDRYGNTSSASIPLALVDAIHNDRVHDGDNLAADRVRRRHDLGQRHHPLGRVSRSGDGPVFVVLAAGRARRYGGVKPLAPVGVGGEAVIDLLASDALAAGFATLVLVIGPATGPAVRYHVERTWPGWVDVHFATQERPLGTAHALLSASDHLPADGAYAVANADDLYGRPALTQLVDHLVGPDPTSALVGFRLRNAGVGAAPVTRGLCQVDPAGRLTAIEERRQVVQTADGEFESGDGRQPHRLDGDDLVSMNLWGFTPAMTAVFEKAMARAADASEEAEVLLPEVVGGLVAGASADDDPATTFSVLAAEGRCIGVTHPDDLALVQADLAHQVGRGERPAGLWADRR